MSSRPDPENSDGARGAAGLASRLATRPSVRFGLRVATVVLLAFGAVEAVLVWVPAMSFHPEITIGYDLHLYLDRTRSWLDGTGFYLPRQLAGPYVVQDGDALYPPPSVLLFTPFVVGVPLVLWWVIPLLAIVAALARIRPPLWTWPVLAAILVYPRTWVVLVFGNPSMWAIGAAVTGMAWGWPAIGSLLKPVFAPFALVGVRHRWWWISLAIVAGVSVLFGTMWLDYATALRNGINPRGVEYLLGEVPIGLAFLLAWLGSRTNPRTHASTPRSPSIGDAGSFP